MNVNCLWIIVCCISRDSFFFLLSDAKHNLFLFSWKAVIGCVRQSLGAGKRLGRKVLFHKMTQKHRLGRLAYFIAVLFGICSLLGCGGWVPAKSWHTKYFLAQVLCDFSNFNTPHCLMLIHIKLSHLMIDYH